jgi:hypothetical protein
MYVQSRIAVSACSVAVDETCCNMGHLAQYKHPQPENTDYLTQHLVEDFLKVMTM